MTYTPSNMKRSSVRAAGVTAVGQVGRFGVIFGSQIVLARLLLPSDFGLVAEVAPVLGLLSVIGSLGVTQGIVQKATVDDEQLTATFWINLFLGLCLSILFAALSPALNWLYGDDRILAVSLCLSAIIFVGSASQVHVALLNRQLKFLTLTGCEMASISLGAVAGIASATYGAGYWALVINQVVVSLTSSATIMLLSDWKPRMSFRLAAARDILGFSAKVTLTNFINYTNLALPNVIVGATLGEYTVGLYDRACKLALQPMQQLTAPVGKVAVPILSRSADNHERFQRQYFLMLNVLILIVVPGVIFLSIFSLPVILTLLGPKWRETAEIFEWVCLGMIPMPLIISTSWVFISTGMVAAQIRATTLIVTFNLLTLVAGIPWGVVGVAKVTTTGLFLLQLPTIIAWMLRHTWISPRDMAAAVYPVIVSCALCYTALAILDDSFELSGIATFLFAPASYFIALAVMLGMKRGRIILSDIVDLARSWK